MKGTTGRGGGGIDVGIGASMGSGGGGLDTMGVTEGVKVVSSFLGETGTHSLSVKIINQL